MFYEFFDLFDLNQAFKNELFNKINQWWKTIRIIQLKLLIQIVNYLLNEFIKKIEAEISISLCFTVCKILNKYERKLCSKSVKNGQISLTNILQFEWKRLDIR